MNSRFLSTQFLIQFYLWAYLHVCIDDMESTATLRATVGIDEVWLDLHSYRESRA